MAVKEDAVARNDLTGLKECNIADDDLVNLDDLLDTATDDLDPSFLFLLVQHLELALLLPVVDGPDTNLIKAHVPVIKACQIHIQRILRLYHIPR